MRQRRAGVAEGARNVKPPTGKRVVSKASLKHIEQVFDEAGIDELVKAAGPTVSFDKAKLRRGVIEAAKAYFDRQARAGNTIRKQILALRAAAKKRNFEQVAGLLSELPANVRQDIISRARRHVARELDPDQRFATTTEPDERSRLEAYCLLGALRVPDLRKGPILADPRLHDAACAAIYELCHYGGRLVQGRTRPSGRASTTWEPFLFAPKMKAYPKIRDPERAFLRLLQLAWLEATGTMPARTAHQDNPGPFARFAKAALKRLGAPHVDAIELINGLDEQ